jgi:hypothetical protein
VFEDQLSGDHEEVGRGREVEEGDEEGGGGRECGEVSGREKMG